MADELFEIRGAENFLKLSKALKQAGHTQLRKELHKGMREAVKQHIPKTREQLDAILPSGLKDRSNVRQAVKVKTGRDPGVTVVVPFGKRSRSGLGASNARMLNRSGELRHPVHADPDKTRKEWRWVDQRIPGAGWFDETWLDAAPEVRVALEKAMDDVIDKIVKGAK